MRKGEGFIICYSITDRRSFEEAVEYKKLIDRVRNRDDIPVVLVGNKSDLEPARKVSMVNLFVLFSKNVWDSQRAQRIFLIVLLAIHKSVNKLSMSNLYHKIHLLWKTVSDRFLNSFNFLFFAGNSP